MSFEKTQHKGDLFKFVLIMDLSMTNSDGSCENLGWVNVCLPMFFYTADIYLQSPNICLSHDGIASGSFLLYGYD